MWVLWHVGKLMPSIINSSDGWTRIGKNAITAATIPQLEEMQGWYAAAVCS